MQGLTCMDSGGGNRNVIEPRTEPGEMALELRFLSFGAVTRVLRFLRICVGVLRDVTVLAPAEPLLPVDRDV